MQWYYTFFLLFASLATAAWDQSLWEERRIIGGPGGNPFSLVGNTGTVVKKLRVYRQRKAKKFLRGLKVFFSDGQEMSTGVEKDEYTEFDFQDGEKITSMTLWGNGIGTRTGRIRFKTDRERDFDYGQDTTGQDEFAMPLGSGVLIGFEGSAGQDINFMSPVFLKPVKDSFVQDVKYPQLKKNEGLYLKTLKQAEVRWTGAPFKFKFTGIEIHVTSTSWTYEFSLSAMFGFKIEAGVPGIGSSSVSTEWTLGFKKTWSGEEQYQSRLDWSIDVDIENPDASVTCAAKYWLGTIDLEWTGTLVLVTADDVVYQFPTSGRMKRVDTSKVIATCQKMHKGVVTQVLKSPTVRPRQVQSIQQRQHQLAGLLE